MCAVQSVDMLVGRPDIPYRLADGAFTALYFTT